MKYAVILALIMLSSCIGNREVNPGFMVNAQIQRLTNDTNKGIEILVYPIERSKTGE